MRALTLVLAVSGLAPIESSQTRPAAMHTHPMGWSFPVPEGWRVQDLARASALAPPDRKHDLTRGDQGHVYAVTAFEGIHDLEDADLILRLRRTLAHNASEPLGQPKREKLNRTDRTILVYTWTFQPRRRAAWQEVRVYLVPDPTSKVTLVLLAASERDLLAPLDAALAQLASSLTFASGKRLGPEQWTDWGFTREKPPGPGMPDPGATLADESVPSQQWFFYLRGKRITPVPGRPAGPAGKDPQGSLDLRQDGTFQGTGAGDPGTGAALRGRWRIVTRAAVTALVLYWERAEPTYHRLDRRGEAILVDDVPTSVIRP